MDIGSSLNSKNYVIKKGRPHGHRYGKTGEQRDYHVAHNWRNASREVLKGFTIASCKIPYFVALNSKLIELKKSVSRCAKNITYRMTQAEHFRYRRN